MKYVKFNLNNGWDIFELAKYINNGAFRNFLFSLGTIQSFSMNTLGSEHIANIESQMYVFFHF